MPEDKEDPKTFYSKELAGKPPLDDDILPNEGEPIPQDPDPEDATAAPIKEPSDETR